MTHSYHGDVCALIPKSGVIPEQINERPRPYLHPHLETGIWNWIEKLELEKFQKISFYYYYFSNNMQEADSKLCVLKMYFTAEAMQFKICLQSICIYPRDSLLVVTNVLPFHTLLNCSGREYSPCWNNNKTNSKTKTQMYYSPRNLQWRLHDREE